MAQRRIEADVVVEVDGAEKVEELADTVATLSDETVKLGVEVEGEDDVRDLSKTVDSLDDATVSIRAKLTDEEKLDSFIRNVRDLDGETATAVLAVRAAQAQAELKQIVATIGDIDSSPADVKVAMTGAEDVQRTISVSKRRSSR